MTALTTNTVEKRHMRVIQIAFLIFAFFAIDGYFLSEARTAGIPADRVLIFQFWFSPFASTSPDGDMGSSNQKVLPFPGVLLTR
jgi:hypothetical protein